MAEAAQTRRLERLDVDYDRLSGRYFGIGALLALLWIVWVIARTSGLFGTPPDDQLKTIQDIISGALWLYTGVGFVVLILVLISRSRAPESVSSSQIVINYAGVVLFLVFASRVSSVVEAEQYSVTLWGLQLVNGLVLGGVYALVALGYTLVYGILFMINFAHGEVLVLGTYRRVVCPDLRDRTGRRHL